MIHPAVLKVIRHDEVRRLITTSPATAELVSRHVAGENVDEAMAVARVQNGHGLFTSLAPVWAGRPEPRDAAKTFDTCLRLVRELSRTNPAGNEISISPGLLGLEDDVSGAKVRLREILRAATDAGVEVTLEMGPVDQVDPTLNLFKEFQSDFPTLGITLQAMLRRTPGDLADITDRQTRIRLCSGDPQALPGELAYRSRHAICLAYVDCLRQLMESQAYPMVATHDLRIIAIAEQLADRTDRMPTEYEFQLFYGVRTIEQRRLVDTGHQCRVYLPFGTDWYDYLMLRLSRRPLSWLPGRLGS